MMHCGELCEQRLPEYAEKMWQRVHGACEPPVSAAAAMLERP